MIFDFFRRKNRFSRTHGPTDPAMTLPGIPKKPKDKPSAVAFVDYEHWYISYDNMYHKKPDIKGWANALTAEYDMQEIIFFADFSNPALRGEISRIREVTNIIIETGNTSAHYKKDFTDFIMLDHIYQKAMTAEMNGSDIDAYIIFTGDGHFSSVVSFITTRLNKPVIIYAVRDALSGQLKSTATASYELPEPEEQYAKTAQLIFDNIKYLEEQNKKKKKQSLPTFWGTIDAVARYYHTSKKEVTDTMRFLVNNNYIYQTEHKISVKHNGSSGKSNVQRRELSVKIINVRWDAAIRDRLYNPCAK